MSSPFQTIMIDIESAFNKDIRFRLGKVEVLEVFGDILVQVWLTLLEDEQIICLCDKDLAGNLVLAVSGLYSDASIVTMEPFMAINSNRDGIVAISLLLS